MQPLKDGEQKWVLWNYHHAVLQVRAQAGFGLDREAMGLNAVDFWQVIEEAAQSREALERTIERYRRHLEERICWVANLTLAQ